MPPHAYTNDDDEAFSKIRSPLLDNFFKDVRERRGLLTGWAVRHVPHAAVHTL